MRLRRDVRVRRGGQAQRHQFAGCKEGDSALVALYCDDPPSALRQQGAREPANSSAGNYANQFDLVAFSQFSVRPFVAVQSKTVVFNQNA